MKQFINEIRIGKRHINPIIENLFYLLITFVTFELLEKLVLGFSILEVVIKTYTKGTL